MPAFQYTAINSKGEKQKGVLEAESAKHARQMLRDKKLTPIEIKPAQQKTTLGSKQFIRQPTLTSKELALVTRQLATLLAAGLPVEEVLAATAEQTEKSRTKG